jgi:hypothetical protein
MKIVVPVFQNGGIKDVEEKGNRPNPFLTVDEREVLGKENLALEPQLKPGT